MKSKNRNKRRVTTDYEVGVNKLGLMHCAVYTVHCTPYTVHRTPYTVRCTLYTVHCTLYTVHCTLYTVHCTLYTVHCTLYTVHCTLYTVYRTRYTPEASVDQVVLCFSRLMNFADTLRSSIYIIIRAMHE